MDTDERQFLKTAAWLFMRHGRPSRALAVCDALVEDDPRDGISAAAAAGLLLDAGAPERALEILRQADMPPSLSHVEAVLETRALKALGRTAESSARWKRHLESKKGPARQWTA